MKESNETLGRPEWNKYTYSNPLVKAVEILFHTCSWIRRFEDWGIVGMEDVAFYERLGKCLRPWLNMLFGLEPMGP